MDEFLRVLRTLAEFPLTVKTTPDGDWYWYFRGRPASSHATLGTDLSRFCGDGSLRTPYSRYRDAAYYHDALSQRLRDVYGVCAIAGRLL